METCVISQKTQKTIKTVMAERKGEETEGKERGINCLWNCVANINICCKLKSACHINFVASTLEVNEGDSCATGKSTTTATTTTRITAAATTTRTTGS